MQSKASKQEGARGRGVGADVVMGRERARPGGPWVVSFYLLWAPPSAVRATGRTEDPNADPGGTRRCATVGRPAPPGTSHGGSSHRHVTSHSHGQRQPATAGHRRHRRPTACPRLPHAPAPAPEKPGRGRGSSRHSHSRQASTTGLAPSIASAGPALLLAAFASLLLCLLLLAPTCKPCVRCHRRLAVPTSGPLGAQSVPET